jgi:hypothetical protein
MSGGGVDGRADALPLGAALPEAIGGTESLDGFAGAARSGCGLPRAFVAVPPKLGLKPRVTPPVSSSPARIVK